MKYTITHGRLKTLLKAEARTKALDLDPSSEHYDENLDYYRDQLVKDDNLLLPIGWDDDIIPVPEEGLLLAKVRNSFDKGVNRIASNYEMDPILNYILGLDNSDVYQIFGCTVDNLEGASYVSSMVIHGLYDDGELGVKDGKVAEVGYDHPGERIYEADLMELLRVKRLSTEYFKGVESTISNSRSEKSEYYRLSEQYNDLLNRYI